MQREAAIHRMTLMLSLIKRAIEERHARMQQDGFLSFDLPAVELFEPANVIHGSAAIERQDTCPVL